DAEVVLVRVGDDEEERLGWWDWLGVGHPSSIPYLFPMIKDVIIGNTMGRVNRSLGIILRYRLYSDITA
ncbi:MAG: hypothetical protein AB7O50_15290, partial [Pseudolabrys sp.]